ncbi:MAG: UPF0149 family protein [Rhodospirillaceae bacterium]|nr:UPF0149 family protein [Rhodospirillaceae bacterium]
MERQEANLKSTDTEPRTEGGVKAALAEALTAFLAGPRSTRLSVHAIDGYLTAIAIGPELVMPSEWLALLWDEEEPVFADANEAQTILSAIMARYNEILLEVDRSPRDFRPLFLPADPNQRPSMALAAQWATGFWKGMALRSDAWRALIADRDARDLLAPIVYLAEDDKGQRLLKETRDEDDELVLSTPGLIPGVVPAIRDYWRRRAGRPTAPQPVRRPGRNEPCPCGSGRKYKRCCGAG